MIPLVGEVQTLTNAFRALKEKDGYLEDAYADAQNKILAYYYVKRFKQGYKDWDVMNGDLAKVIKVKELYGKIAD